MSAGSWRRGLLVEWESAVGGPVFLAGVRAPVPATLVYLVYLCLPPLLL